MVGRVRHVRKAHRRRRELPALALPAPENGRADYRTQARHGWLLWSGFSEEGTRCYVVPRVDRRSHRDRCAMNKRVDTQADTAATIEIAVAALDDGPLTATGVAAHVAPLFARVLERRAS